MPFLEPYKDYNLEQFYCLLTQKFFYLDGIFNRDLYPWELDEEVYSLQKPDFVQNAMDVIEEVCRETAGILESAQVKVSLKKIINALISIESELNEYRSKGIEKSKRGEDLSINGTFLSNVETVELSVMIDIANLAKSKFY